MFGVLRRVTRRPQPRELTDEERWAEDKVEAMISELAGPHDRGMAILSTEDEVLEADRELQKQVALVLADRVVDSVEQMTMGGYPQRPDPYYLHGPLGGLLRRKLPWTDPELARLVGRLADGFGKARGWSGMLPVVPIVGAAERATNGDPEPRTGGELGRLASALHLAIERLEVGADERKALERVCRLLEAEDEGPVLGRDPWATALLEAAGGDTDLMRLLSLASEARTSRPTKAFDRGAGELTTSLGAETMTRTLRSWLELMTAERGDDRDPVIPPQTGDLLRGLVWLARAFPDPATAKAVGDLADTCLKKVSYYGARSAKVANACLSSLAEMGPAGAAQLGRLRTSVKHASTRERLEQAITEAAESQGMTVDELEESMVPDFGLDPTGGRSSSVGEHAAELRIGQDSSVALGWVREDGRRLKSAPKAVREEHGEALKDLRAEVKEARVMVAAQKARLERLMAVDRAWTYGAWCERYRDHGLVGALTRRLIWRIGSLADSETALWLEDGWVDVSGRSVAEPTDEAEVRLWHPIGVGVEEVRAWRVFLEEREILQPFKQAHREVYLLTDAERETRTYSNRFAGHVLRQHQMAALCRERGWEYTLQGAWDSANEPTLGLPQWDLTVAFWVEAPHSTDDFGETGVFDHVLSDQVRFLDSGGESVDLVDVPRLAFTEAMRDIDLFVGVCSIGNDPEWRDRGEVPAFNDYWLEYSFGELSERAEVRQELLERLLPKLRIADRCEIDGRFLRVRGSRRTYKIHLGSSNIQMEPNAEYLCIVRDRVPREQRGRGFLPFEGDTTLSLILSKAFLLADDHKIEDPVILNQIGH